MDHHPRHHRRDVGARRLGRARHDDGASGGRSAIVVAIAVPRCRRSPTSSPTRSSRGAGACRADRSSSTSSGPRHRPTSTTTRPRDEVAIAAGRPLVSLAIGSALLAVSAVVGVLVDDRRAALIAGTWRSWSAPWTSSSACSTSCRPSRSTAAGSSAASSGRGPATRAPGCGPRLASGGSSAGPGRAAVVGILAISWSSTDRRADARLCGWFLISTARTVDRRAGLEELLDGLSVAEVMERDVAGDPARADARHVRRPGPRRRRSRSALPVARGRSCSASSGRASSAGCARRAGPRRAPRT